MLAHNNKASSVSSFGASFVGAPANTSCRRAVRVPVYNRRLRSCTQLRLSKASRDPLASPKAKNAVKVSMALPARISLPSTLPRPTPRPIDIRVLREACPEVKEATPSYLREHLSMMAPHMLAGIESTTIMAPASHLPAELPVSFADAVSIPNVAPTHILALQNQCSVGKDKYTLFPIHQLPFAAHCSSFPALPSSSTATPLGNRASTATLPVVRMAIPSVDAFPLFQSYMYVKDTEALRATFLTPGWTLSTHTIMVRALIIKGFWANAVAFGMVDTAMYNVIEDCWAELLRALQRATSSTPPSSS